MIRERLLRFLRNQPKPVEGWRRHPRVRCEAQLKRSKGHVIRCQDKRDHGPVHAAGLGRDRIVWREAV